MSKALKRGVGTDPGSAAAPGDEPTGAADLASRVVAWQRLHGRHGLPWQVRTLDAPLAF
jgi:hypothetical protein